MIVIYDTDCGVCQAFIEWLRKRDRHGAFEFVGNDAPQLPAGVSREETGHTIVVLEGGRKSVRAEGIARLLRELRGWSALGAALRVPGVKQLANLGYDAFAKRRHRVSAALGMRACAIARPPARRPATDRTGAT